MDDILAHRARILALELLMQEVLARLAFLDPPPFDSAEAMRGLIHSAAKRAVVDGESPEGKALLEQVEIQLNILFDAAALRIEEQQRSAGETEVENAYAPVRNPGETLDPAVKLTREEDVPAELQDGETN